MPTPLDARLRPMLIQYRPFAYLLVSFIFTLIASGSSTGEEPPPSKIAFGSCLDQNKPSPILKEVLQANPDLFIFLGDNVYADTLDPKVMRAKYEKLGANPDYQALRKACPILATWDDHDYGINDGGANNPIRDKAQKEFLDFFQVPKDSPRRMRKGVYAAHYFGPTKTRLQIILLDTRYFRGPLQRKKKRKRGQGPYRPSSDERSTMLGEDQWKWLAEELRKPAAIRILGSSIQVVADEHGYESWGNLPHERKRLFKLIKETKANGLIMISGDRHMAELSKMDGGFGYPAFDLTSSSLNRPGSARIVRPSTKRIGKGTGSENFGVIEIDWKAEPHSLTLKLYDKASKVVLEHAVKLKELEQEKSED